MAVRFASQWLLAFLWATACLMILSCSTSDVAGGGVDVPNSIAGVLVDTDGEAATNRSVVLAKLALSLDSTVEVESVERTTNDYGEYIFDNLDSGKYVVSAPDTGDGLAGSRTVVTLTASEMAVVDTLSLMKSVVLAGTYIVPPHLASNPLFIRVTGMNLPARVFPGGRYAIPGVPRGDFEIVFVIADVVNTFSFNIPDDAADTVHLQPLHLSFFEEEAESVNYAYIDVTEHCFQIVPRSPPPGPPIEYLIFDKEGRREPVPRPKPKPGDVLTGVLSLGTEEVTITTDSATYTFPKDRLRFPPEEGQNVMLLVDGDTVIDVKPLDGRPLKPPPDQKPPKEH